MKSRVAAFIVLSIFLGCAPLAFGSYGLYIIALTMVSCVSLWGLNIVFGYTGQLSLGHAGFVAVGAYTSAMLLGAGVNLPLSIAAAAGAGALAGFVIGLPSVRVHGVYLALITFGFGEIIRQLIIHTPWLNSSDGIAVSSGGGSLATYYYAVAVSVVFILIAWRIIASRVGSAFVAVRENEISSEAIGLAVPKLKVLAFVFAGLFAGAAGALYGIMKGFVHPDDFDLASSIMYLMVIIVGGAGTLLGPLLAAAFLVLLPELLREVQDYRVLIYGVILLLSIVFFPNGIVELAGRLNFRHRARQKKDENSLRIKSV